MVASSGAVLDIVLWSVGLDCWGADLRASPFARACFFPEQLFAATLVSDPATTPAKKPIAFDKEHPFRNLGIRVVDEKPSRSDASLSLRDVVLTLRVYSGINGVQQMLKEPML